MQEPNTITRDFSLPTSLDFKALKVEGLRYLQELAGSIWTDYNQHDPGITLLEQICYALTDVAYRTNTDIQKLLFSEGEFAEVSESNALYEPHKILPNCPLTLTDYRILVIDRIKEVNNAWFQPIEDHELGIQGLYDVVIQIAHEVRKEDYVRIETAVKLLLSSHRNLCEDINKVKILKPLPIAINGSIDTTSGVEAEEILAEIFFQIDQYFNPVVKFHTYEELLEEGLGLEEIFTTTSFDHGFILPGELYPKKSEFHVTKIAEIISSIPGIRHLKNLVIKSNGIKVVGNTIKVQSGYFPDLDVNATGGIYLSKGGVPYEYNPSVTRHLFEVKQDKSRTGYELKNKWKSDEQQAPFKYGKIADFSSIQNTLPGVYGVGRFGLPDGAGQERKAKARQLKGYLLLFDQIMSNHLIQLQNIKELFSLDNLFSETYYGKLPVDFPNLKEILVDPTDESVQDVLASFDDRLSRKDRVLDHLLARFGECFIGDVNGKVKSLFAYPSEGDVEEQVIRLKANFLKEYKQLSVNRSLAFNYLRDSIDNDNIPTFKHRACFILNVKDHRQRSLTYNYKHLKINVSQPGSRKLSYDMLTQEDGQELLYRRSDNAQKITFLINDRRTLEYLFLNGANRGNYKIVPHGSTSYTILFQAKKEEVPASVCETRSTQEAKEITEKLVTYFENLNASNEGFHVVEHILLRPYGTDQYHFQILDKHDAPLFESVKTDDLEAQKLAAEDTILAGTKQSNFKRTQVKVGTHAILLKYAPDKNVRLQDTFSSEEAAAKKINDLVNYFQSLEQSLEQSLAKDDTALQKKVVYKLQKAKYKPQSKDFYNSMLSIVLPGWIPRFQNEEFGLLMGNCIRESLPAHIDINFIWLDLEEMKNFESIQKQWLSTRKAINFDWKKLNTLSDKLVHILKKEQNEGK